MSISPLIRSMVALSALAATACAPTDQEWTRESSEQATARVYQGVAPAEAIRQAETVLRLADGKDVRFSYGPNSFVAQRDHLIYMVLAAAPGTFSYHVNAESVPGGTKVRMTIANQSTAILPGAVVPQIPTTVPSATDQVRMVEPYDLYFSRLDYLLGKSGEWVSCSDAPKKFGGTMEAYAALCRSAADNRPSQ